MTRALYLKYERRKDMALIDTMSQFMDEAKQVEIDVLENYCLPSPSIVPDSLSIQPISRMTRRADPFS